MKKEIEIEFKYLKATLKENLIIDVYINDEKADEITLKKDCVFLYADIPVCLILGIEDRSSLKDYLDIPEIKAIHDEYFKKEVDLFGWVKNQNKYFFYDEFGRVHEYALHRYNSQHIKELKKNYNMFPSEETCANASVMSLDDRKQYLFAIVKGYEVLTRKDVAGSRHHNSLYFDSVDGEWLVFSNSCDGTQNIHFKKFDHAQECAKFMDESEGE